MSLIYEGRFHTFSPVTYLDRMDLTVIRPLMYMNEADVIGFVNKNQVPVVKSPCPADGYTKREYVKQLLKKLNQENPGVKERMFTAIQDGGMTGWAAAGHQPQVTIVPPFHKDHDNGGTAAEEKENGRE